MAVNLSFELFPGRSLTALYVRDLSNGSQLTSVHSLHVAANRALHSETTKFKTYNLHTELVFLYAAHHNIAQNLKKFGLSPGQTDAILLLFDATEDSMNAAVSYLGGKRHDFSDAARRQVVPNIKKHYKLSDAEIALSGLSDAVITRISTHGI